MWALEAREPGRVKGDCIFGKGFRGEETKLRDELREPKGGRKLFWVGVPAEAASCGDPIGWWCWCAGCCCCWNEEDMGSDDEEVEDEEDDGVAAGSIEEEFIGGWG